MIKGMEPFVGMKLVGSVIQRRLTTQKGKYYIVTRPDFYSAAIHINMYIYFDSDGYITDFDGDKCYSVCRGLYNRHANVYEREFTKRDIQYLRRFIKDNTE